MSKILTKLIKDAKKLDDSLEREHMERLLALCPKSYQELFGRIYPDGVKKNSRG